MANIIKQLIDADGNNIYPIAYAQGGVKMDLLWTNPSPTSNFSAQTISHDNTKYSWFYVETFGTNGNTYGYTNVVEKGLRNHILGYVGGRLSFRSITITDSGFVYTDNSYINTYGTGTTDNSYLLPYRIYGIQTSWIVPTTVQGLQYVEV